MLKMSLLVVIFHKLTLDGSTRSCKLLLHYAVILKKLNLLYFCFLKSATSIRSGAKLLFIHEFPTYFNMVDNKLNFYNIHLERF